MRSLRLVARRPRQAAAVVVAAGAVAGLGLFTLSALAATPGTVSFDVTRYALDDSATVTVTDGDLNASAVTLDSATVTITSASDPDGILVTLQETGLNTGVFNTSVPPITFTTEATDDFQNKLKVAANDTITAVYNDASPSTAVTATAQMFTDDASSSLNARRYRLNTPATLRVTDADRNTSTTSAQSLTAKFSSTTDANGVTVTLNETGNNTGIFEGTSSFNLTASTSTTPSLQVAAGDTVTVTYDEPAFAGGTTTTPPTATAVMYNDNATAAVGDNTDDVYIVGDTATLNVEDVDRNGDPAVVETVTATLTSTSDSTGITVTLTERDADDSDFDGTATFNTTATSGTSLKVASGDTVTLTYAEPNLAGSTTNKADTARIAQDGTTSFDKPRYRTATDNHTATVKVLDRDLNTSTTTVQTVDVNVKSTSDPIGITITLTEKDADDTEFNNSGAPLAFNTTASSPGSLKVAAGDTVTATYAETTTMTGVAATRTATALVYADTATATFDRTRYQRPDTATVTVHDADRNNDPATAQSFNVNVKSTKHTTGVTVPLTETGGNTGIFTGTVGFTTLPSTGTMLEVEAGNTVTLTYDEPVLAGGTSARTATATMFSEPAEASIVDKDFYIIGDTATLTVTDHDRNLDPNAAETVSVGFTSGADATGITVTLTESGPNTGVFTGTATFGSGPSSGNTLRVAGGNTVTITYAEPTFAGGTPTPRTDTARIAVNGTVTLDKTLYQQSQTATVTVADADLNTAAGTMQSEVVNVKSTSDPIGISVTLNEDGNNSSNFKKNITFTTGASGSDVLHVEPGNTVTVTYRETTTIDGVAADRTTVATMYSDTATPQLNATRYRLHETATLTVNDSDRNTSATGAQSFTVKFHSTTDTDGIIVTLTETGNDTGIFSGTAAFNTTASTVTPSPSLRVAAGDTVTVTYEEPTFAGATAPLTATATMHTNTATAAIGSEVYILSDTVTSTVTDIDRNRSNATVESITANLKSTSDATGITLTLTETGANSNQFTAASTFTSGPSSGSALKAASGDTITLTYLEPKFEDATDRLVTDTARMAQNGTVSLDKAHYRLAGDNHTATLRVTDADLNTDTGTPQTASATLHSASDPVGINVTLTETGGNTGIFSGTAGFTTGLSGAGQLKAVTGDLVTMTYRETTTLNGVAADRTATATMYVDTATATLDKPRYGVGDTAALTVADIDRNQNRTSAEMFTVNIKSTTNGTGISRTLTETGVDTGIFTGTASFTTTPGSSTVLQVSPGDTVVLTYDEPKFDGTTPVARTAVASMHLNGAATLDAARYDLDDTATVTVTDPDLNTSSSSKQTATVNLASDSDTAGVAVTVTETANNSGTFTGTATFTTGGSFGSTLKVAGGDDITVTYNETTRFSGPAANVTDDARMAVDGSAALNATRYRINQTANLEVTDPELDNDSSALDSVVVNLKSTTDAAGVNVTLTETATSTGVFRGTATFNTTASSGSQLRVAQGDTVTLTYAETTTFAGPNANRTDTATIYKDDAAATLDLDRYSLATPAVLSVTDADSNADPNAAETVTAKFTSESDPAGLTLVLTETGNDTGVFTKLAGFTADSSSGVSLKAAAGDTVTLAFEEPNASGVGTVTDSDTAVMNVNGSAALDAARYQLDDTATLQVTDADLNTAAGSAQTVLVNLKSASDTTGVSVTLTETGVNSGLFSGTATFTSGASTGTTLHVASGDGITLTYNETSTFEGPAAARTDTATMATSALVTLDKLRYAQPDTATLRVTDADLNAQSTLAETTTATLKSTSDSTGITVVLSETGTNTGIFSATATFGTTASAGTTLKVAAGDTVTLTHNDANTFEGPVADRTTTATMLVDTATAMLDREMYNIADTAALTVTDVDRNTNRTSVQTVTANLKSTADATGITVTLTETGVDTGVFTATATFGSAPSSGTTLKTSPGDVVTATYTEPTFAGSTAARTDTATVTTNGTAALDAAHYQLDDTATLTVTDPDLNTAAGSAQTVAVNLKSGADTTGVGVTLTETGANTGVFSGTATFTTGTSSGAALKVAAGNTVTMTYNETTTFDGPAAERVATALMSTNGAAALDAARYQLDDTATVTVTDPDLNTAAGSAQSVAVNLKSGADTTGVGVTLTETGANTGVFSGTAMFTTGTSSGAALKVAAGNTVTMTYNETTTFDGPAADRVATAVMSTNGAAALDKTQYTETDTATLTVTDPDLNTAAGSAQSVTVNLRSNSDATGVTVGLTETGANTGIFTGTARFTTGPSGGSTLKVASGDTVTLTYAETTTFEGPAADRTATAAMLNDNATVAFDKGRYQLPDTATMTVTDADRNTNATTAETVSANVKPSSDPAGQAVTLTETGVNTGVFAGTVTFTTGSPSGTTLQVGPGATVTLTYIEPSFAPGIVPRSASALMARNGTTTLSSPLYELDDTATVRITDADLNTSPDSAQTATVTLTSTADTTGVSVTLTETGVNTGEFSGTATFTTAASSGAALKVVQADTVTLTYPETTTFEGPPANRVATARMTTNGTVALDKSAYNSGDTATLTVTDVDRNTSSSTAETTTVTLKSTSDPAGIVVTTTETGPNTGVFRGTATLGSSSSSGHSIKVGDGDTVTLVYTEASTFEGPDTDRTATATVNKKVVTATKSGYWLTGSDGRVYAFGDAPHKGDLAGVRINGAIVALLGTPSGNGYWLAASDGAVYAFGDAPALGSMGGQRLNQPIVGMASTPNGKGYWLVASDGGIFSFGEARFHGSMGGRALNKPMVGIASTPSGNGYWTVASDGGIFSFGDATFRGSMGSSSLNKPVIGMTAVTRTDAPQGYRLVASDGGIFSFGAPFFGSLGSTTLNQPITGMSTVPSGQGYRMVAADGGVFSFGPDAPARGSAAGTPKSAPVVAMGGF